MTQHSVDAKCREHVCVCACVRVCVCVCVRACVFVHVTCVWVVIKLLLWDNQVCECYLTVVFKVGVCVCRMMSRDYSEREWEGMRGTECSHPCNALCQSYTVFAPGLLTQDSSRVNTDTHMRSLFFFTLLHIRIDSDTRTHSLYFYCVVTVTGKDTFTHGNYTKQHSWVVHSVSHGFICYGICS